LQYTLRKKQKIYLQSSKVNDTVNVGVGLEDLVEASLIGDIQLNELGLLAADQLDPIQGFHGGVVQVVGNDDLVASLEQSEGGEGANVASATVDRRKGTESATWTCR
jgi:hypothetical protein